MTPLSFIHELDWDDLPDAVRERAALHLLDLLGVAAGGSGTRLSAIARDYAVHQHAGARPVLLDDRTASETGAALAAGMTIDALDGHDGYNPAKGHAGAVVLPALLALAPRGLDGRAFLTALVLGYEIGCRAAVVQHRTVADYHTSGSWGAVAAAAVGARLLGLGAAATAHALGIAEYHGPRSQMMRCIDHPTMLKDGAGWGAMCGTSAALLAEAGFTGAPSLLAATGDDWDDLGRRWLILEQYFKPWPVCRWAQGPIEGILALKARHGVAPGDVARIEIETFHEAVRLATARPRTTEEAQYSTAYPAAVALVFGDVTAEAVGAAALDHPEVRRLADATVMTECDAANAAFPARRLARVALVLKDGARLAGDWVEPRWSATDPPAADEIRAKFHRLAAPRLGKDRAEAVERAVLNLADTPLAALEAVIYGAISRSASGGSSASSEISASAP